MGGKCINLIGQRFGKLTVLERAANKGGVAWFCQCDCGRWKHVIGGNLCSGKSTTCGSCEAGKHLPNDNYHGYAGTPTYESWRSMRRRVLSDSPKSKKWYKDKGITVCDRWNGSDCFLNFLSDMGERPVRTTLDRIDSNGNYEPSNCRWSTYSVQRLNQNR